MPNWTANKLRLVAKTEEALALLPQLLNGFRAKVDYDECAFQIIDPTPQELLDNPSPLNDEKKAEAFVKKYGSTDWYAWRVKHWGTKWDSNNDSVEEIENGLLAAFDTAWSPPIGIYQKLQAKGFDVLATYIECGTMFAGIWHNGEEADLEVFVPEVEGDEYPFEDAHMVLRQTFTGMNEDLMPHHLGG